jgi:hypothetical protein
LKNKSGSKKYLALFVLLLLFCAVFCESCGGDAGANSSSTSSAQAAFTPIGQPATCLTVKSPSLLKLADGNYKLGDEIDNCGGKPAGSLKVTLQINTQTINLLGPTTIPAKGKATYSSLSSPTSKEIHFPSHSSSTVVTILATSNSSMQGEWDGEVTIPA